MNQGRQCFLIHCFSQSNKYRAVSRVAPSKKGTKIPMKSWLTCFVSIELIDGWLFFFSNISCLQTEYVKRLRMDLPERVGQPIYRHILKFHKRHFAMMYTKNYHKKSSYFFQMSTLSLNNFVINVNLLVQF